MKLRTPSESAALDARIKAGICAGKAPEVLAAELGTKTSYIYTVLRRRLGFQKMLLDAAERTLINARRAVIVRRAALKKSRKGAGR